MDAETRERSTRSLLEAARHADLWGRYEEAARLAEMAVASRAATDDVDARTAALVLSAALARHAGRVKEAQERLDDARVAAATSTISSCTRAEFHLEAALAALDQGSWEAADRDLANALRSVTDGAAGEPAGRSDAAVELDSVRIRVRAATGLGLRLRGAYDEAERELVAAVGEAGTRLGSPAETAPVRATLNLVHVLVELGVLYKFMAAYPASLSAYERALSLLAGIDASDHPDVATIEHDIGGLLHAMGNHHSAEPHARRAVELHEASLGADHLSTVLDRSALAAVLDGLGRSAEAETMLLACVDALERTIGPVHREVAVALNNLAAIAQRDGRLVHAESCYRRAVAIKEETVGSDAPSLAITLNNLGSVLRKQGRVAEARDQYERALGIIANAAGNDHPLAITIRRNLARIGDRSVSST